MNISADHVIGFGCISEQWRMKKIWLQIRLEAVFIWRLLVSAMWMEDCKAICLNAKLFILPVMRLVSLSCPFVVLQCLGGGPLYPITGCLECVYYLRLPLPIFFLLLCSFKCASHFPITFISSLLVSYTICYHSLLPCWALWYGQSQNIFGVSK